MKTYPLFNSFAVGELDPKLHARVETDVYRNGAKVMTNMVSQPSGPAVSRGGFRLLQTISNVTGVKFLPVVRTTDLEVSALLTAYDSTSTYYVFGFGLSGLASEYSNFGDHVITKPDPTLITSFPNSQAFSYMEKGGLILHSQSNHEVEVQFDDIASTDTEFLVTIRFEKQLTTDVVIEISEYLSPSENLLGTYTVNNTDCFRTLVTKTSTYDLRVTMSLTSWVPVDVCVTGISAIATNLSVTGTTHVYTQADLPSIQFAEEPSTGYIIITHPSYAPRILYPNATGFSGSWTLSTITFTAAPSQWTSGNYPATCCFYGGRSWWSGCPSNPGRLWASKVNEIYNMTTGTGDSDAIDLTRTKPCNIVAMMGSRKLLVFTDVDSFSIESVTGGAVTWNTIKDVPQGSVGVAPVPCIDLNKSVVFVASDRQRIYKITYDRDRDAWVEQPLNTLGMHLFRGKSIQELAYLNNEPAQLFVRFTDNTLVVGTYNVDADIYGWQPVNTYKYAIAISVTRRHGKDYLHVAFVNRTTQVKVSIEEYSPDILLDHFDEYMYPDGTTENEFPNMELLDQPFYLQHEALSYYPHGITFAYTTTYWSAVQGTYADKHWKAGVVGSTLNVLTLLRQSGQLVGYKPDYLRLDVDYTTVEAESDAFPVTLTISVHSVSDNVLYYSQVTVNTLDKRKRLIFPLDYSVYDEAIDSISISVLSQVAVTAPAFILNGFAFADSQEELETLDLFGWAWTDTVGEVFQSMVMPVYAINDDMYVSITEAQHLRFGMAFKQTLQTLQPRFDMVTGSGRATVRGSARAYIGLLDSEIPTVDGKIAKPLDDTEMDGDTVVQGLCVSTKSGSTRTMTVSITQDQPKRLEVSEVILSIDQSEV